MKKILATFFIIFLPYLTAECLDSQIDINTASASQLDEITYVGPATAEKIIESRPFESIDELIDVYGIGEVKLQAIKDQGLACVEGSTQEKETENPEEVVEKKTDDKEKRITKQEPEIEEISYTLDEKIQDAEELNVIKLEPKNIKTEDYKEENKNKYPTYGFIVFCCLLVVLFILKKWR